MYADIVSGFFQFIHPFTFFCLFSGTLAGVIIGVLPGLGPTMAIAILVPLTFNMMPLPAMAFLLGIYVGGIFGGSVSAILINTPGTPAAAATLLDGYPLSRQGKAKKALKMALYASVFGNTFSVCILVLITGTLASIALKFGPPEYAALILFSLTVIGALTGKSLVTGLLSGFLGLFLATFGPDPVDGSPRFSFGIMELGDGFNILPMMIGLFAISEVLMKAEKKITSFKNSATLSFSDKPEDNRVSWKEFKESLRSMFRSSAIGAFVGALPGLGSGTAAFLSYGFAARGSKNRKNFGKGVLEGVAAAESGNNAVCGSAMIPLLALSIPGDLVTAVLLGALMIHGLTPGPLLFQTHMDVVYGIYMTLALSSIVLLFIGLLSFKFFGFLTKMPRYVIFPIVVVLCFAGSYGLKNSLFDVLLYVLFWPNRLYYAKG